VSVRHVILATTVLTAACGDELRRLALELQLDPAHTAKRRTAVAPT
jgi:hypothetical protein